MDLFSLAKVRIIHLIVSSDIIFSPIARKIFSDRENDQYDG